MPSSNRPKDTLNKKASFEILINNKVLSNQFRVNSIITKKGINQVLEQEIIAEYKDRKKVAA